MRKFKSSRSDKRGHRTPLSPKEPSKTFGVKVPESWLKKLKKVSRDTIRAALKKLIN